MFKKNILQRLAVVWLLTLLLLPLFYLLFFLYKNSAITNFSWQILFNKAWFSFYQALLTVIISVFIGGGLAWLGYFWQIKNSKFFDLLMVLPVFLPAAMVGLGFVSVWGNSGYINDALNYLGFARIKFLYSSAAIVAANCFYNIPLSYLAINLRLDKTHRHLQEQSELMGASSWLIFKTVTWPRLAKIVMGVSFLIFLYSFTSFALPLILGGVRYQTLEVYIYQLITQHFSFRLAGYLALGQFVFLISLLVIFWRKDNNFFEDKLDIRKNNFNFKFLFIWLFRLLIIIFILSPLLGVISDAFFINNWYLNYQLLVKAGFWPAILRTFLLVIFSLFNLFFLILFFLSWEKKIKKWPGLILAVSPIFLGLAWFLFYGKSIWAMVFAYVVLLFPLSYYLLQADWSSRPVYWLDSLKILGATNTRIVITSLQYLMSSLIRVISLITAYIFGDIAIANLLSPYLKPTAMSLSYDLIGYYRFGAAALGMSLVLFCIFFLIFFLNIIYYVYTNKKFNC